MGVKAMRNESNFGKKLRTEYGPVTIEPYHHHYAVFAKENGSHFPQLLTVGTLSDVRDWGKNHMRKELPIMRRNACGNVYFRTKEFRDRLTHAGFPRIAEVLRLAITSEDIYGDNFTISLNFSAELTERESNIVSQEFGIYCCDNGPGRFYRTAHESVSNGHTQIKCHIARDC